VHERVTVSRHPLLSVAINVIVCVPSEGKLNVGFCCVEVFPPPKSQFQATTLNVSSQGAICVDKSVKIAPGAQNIFGSVTETTSPDILKFAIGFGFTYTRFSIVSLQPIFVLLIRRTLYIPGFV